MTPGERFAQAFAAKDSDAVREVLTADVDFRALTPGKFWQATNPDEVVAILFGSWLGDHDRVDALENVDEGVDVADTHRVSYRLALTTASGPHVMEQQAYYRTDGDRISYARVMCSGFRPVA